MLQKVSSGWLRVVPGDLECKHSLSDLEAQASLGTTDLDSMEPAFFSSPDHSILSHVVYCWAAMLRWGSFTFPVFRQKLTVTDKARVIGSNNWLSILAMLLKFRVTMSNLLQCSFSPSETWFPHLKNGTNANHAVWVLLSLPCLLIRISASQQL